jgi:peptide/nickel transport system substrate-binding protein
MDPNPDNNLSSSPDSSPAPAPSASAGNSSLGPDEQSPITPPTPGQVVSVGTGSRPPAVPTVSAPPRPVTGLPPDAPVEGPPSQVVTSQHGGGKKRWLKAFLLLIIIALLAAGGWLAYQKHHNKVKAPAAQSKDIPILKIGILNADYGNLYPDMSDSEYATLVNAQMFEGLVRYEDKSKIVPNLATDWTNPDDKTWLFTVKSGIKFHDGHTLAASDVKYSIDAVIASNSQFSQAFAATIASVDVVGENQVKITTKDPDPTLLNKLTALYVIDANLPKGDDPSQAGTGPYEIKPGTVPTNTNLQMVTAGNYHGKPPTTKALVFGNADTVDGLLKAFQTHQFNIVGPIPPGKTAAGATKFVATEPNVDFIGFNTVKPGPLQNKLVREAIRYAVNPGAVGKARGNEVTPRSQMIPESSPGYNAAIMPYKQDINKAKQLLTQAGYPNGVTIRLSTAQNPEATTELVNELKKAGITATVDNHNDFDEFIDYFTSGQAEMFTVDYTSETLDGLDVYNSTLQSTNYNNPKLNDVLNQAKTTVDPAKRLKLLQQAATIIDQDVAVVPLNSEENVWLMDENYAIKQDTPSSLISVYFSNVHRK